MKTINQYKVAEWLGVKATTLSNILCGNRRPSRLAAKTYAEKSGVSFEDWMLSDGEQLKKKVFIAYTVAHENIAKAKRMN
jgi:transcriptional regulator with XRE-family HTH domain